ncbi:lactonase [Rhizobium sp. PP-F2F-G38]|nr:lactonase [Rhizobium sp. PP-WC-1G-195]PYE93596.1 lactonase [Rhizobium sp. PP-F2F-G38]TCL89110.1 lactonase [Rhizobium sp. PP-WC-2G-219]TCP80728.1 lactonase [Rhizobium sp. PP-CC-2G-626]TCQ03546.1 lactonase [Rhizobium sp. PP-F2F-G36]TCQ19373.1 lactonase [Rhizobium sp. PP-CC-3G-465]
MPGLQHDALSRSSVPIPPSERGLQTVEAEPYFRVSDQPLVLEGAVFDRRENLLFVDAASGRVFRLSPRKQLEVIVPKNTLGASGLGIHKDGRIFITSVGDTRQGSIRAVDPDGSNMQTIIGEDRGFLANDIVFDSSGGFYFTDSHGSSTDGGGGVFYADPDLETVLPVMQGLAVGNGIALSPSGGELWVTEHGKNTLHRVRLLGRTGVAPFGSTVAYYFTGPAPDGARVDSEGNVYVAISGQGRVLVFNRNGLPIGQVVLPEREGGRNLKSTSLAIRPGSDELLIVANSGNEPGGAMIFRSQGFATALPLYSHQ